MIDSGGPTCLQIDPSENRREDQAEYNAKEEEGVPGRDGGLGRNQEPSLSKGHLWSETFCRRTIEVICGGQQCSVQESGNDSFLN